MTVFFVVVYLIYLVRRPENQADPILFYIYFPRGAIEGCKNVATTGIQDIF